MGEVTSSHFSLIDNAGTNLPQFKTFLARTNAAYKSLQTEEVLSLFLFMTRQLPPATGTRPVVLLHPLTFATAHFTSNSDRCDFLSLLRPPLPLLHQSHAFPT